MPRGELRDRVLKLLRGGHKARRSRRSPQRPAQQGHSRHGADRPAPRGDQPTPGAGTWEGDLIIGKGNRSQVGTLVERTTLFVALVRLEDGRAETVAQAFATIFQRFQSQMRRSMTNDQGTEMHHHGRLTEQTGVEVYFADPHAPWQRGIAENTNGLLRQYLPKSTDLSLFTQDQLDDIAWRLNTRPRKTLNWKAQQSFLPEGDFDFHKFYAFPQ